MKREIFRIIDANFNRSREGLRVCEEVARFVWNSKPLTSELKSVRHALSAILKDTPSASEILRKCRDTVSDVGKRQRTRSEMSRISYRDIFDANIERVKESLRVLEEFYKLVDNRSSKKITRLRFKVYDIEKRSL